MKQLFKQFIKEEEGSLVEYLLLIAVAGMLVSFLFPGLKDNLVQWFNDMVSNITTGINGSNGSVSTTTGTTA